VHRLRHNYCSCFHIRNLKEATSERVAGIPVKRKLSLIIGFDFVLILLLRHTFHGCLVFLCHYGSLAFVLFVDFFSLVTVPSVVFLTLFYFLLSAIIFGAG